MKRNYIIPKSTDVLINPEDLIAQSMGKTDDETPEQLSRHNDDNAWDTEW